MAERSLDLTQKLRYALEEGRPAECPDDFSKLIAAVLDLPDPEKKHYTALCGIVVGTYMQGEMTLFANWACGAVSPAPLMRRKAVRMLRTHFADLLKGP